MTTREELLKKAGWLYAGDAFGTMGRAWLWRDPKTGHSLQITDWFGKGEDLLPGVGEGLQAFVDIMTHKDPDNASPVAIIAALRAQVSALERQVKILTHTLTDNIMKKVADRLRELS